MTSRHQHTMCSNCGELGHVHKRCASPRLSYGIIAIHVRSQPKIFDDIQKYLSSINKLSFKKGVKMNNLDVSSLELFQMLKSSIEVLLIMNRHTHGFSDFIRGKYCATNIEQLRFLFKEMTQSEKEIISHYYDDFDALWKHFWNVNKNPTQTTSQDTNVLSDQSSDKSYDSQTDDTKNATEQQTNNTQITHEKDIEHTSCNKKRNTKYLRYEKCEYECSKNNFEYLKRSSMINLRYLLTNVRSDIDCPEWGVPKGRRIGSETDLETATREFTEETGYKRDDFILFDNIRPYEEFVNGTNGIQYKYVYYIALLKTDKITSFKDLKQNQFCEIGDIGLFDLNTALTKIRSIYGNRRNIVYSIFVNIFENSTNQKRVS